jgi:superoxide dismutase, Cu-Zn family
MRILPLASCALVALSACMTGAGSTSTASSTTTTTSTTTMTGASGTADVRDAAGRSLGTLTLMEMAGHLMMSGTLRGLPPGTHGIHLHAVGRCDAPAFTSAGAHWNPTSRMHGMDNPQGPHMGDMRNLSVDADGMANVSTSTMGGMLRGMNGALDADGLSVVVHAAADDYRTDPSGNSGARVACGVVMP